MFYSKLIPFKQAGHHRDMAPESDLQAAGLNGICFLVSKHMIVKSVKFFANIRFFCCYVPTENIEKIMIMWFLDQKMLKNRPPTDDQFS